MALGRVTLSRRLRPGGSVSRRLPVGGRVRVSTSAAGYWRADAYDPVNDRIIEPRNLLHAKVGSIVPAMVRDGRLYHVGTTTDYADCPDSAALDMAGTGGVDLRWAGSLDDWTPAADNVLAGKLDTAAFTGYGLRVTATSGALTFSWGNGSAVTSFASTVAPTVSDGGLLALRCVFEPSVGGTSKQATFYTKATTKDTAFADVTSDASWVALGAVVSSATATSITAGDEAFMLGRQATPAAAPLSGTTFAVCVKNGIAGSTVASPDFTAQANDTWSFADAQANRWQVRRAAAVKSGHFETTGVAGNYFSVPDSALNSVTGDLDVIKRVTLNKWIPPGTQMLVAKDDGGTQRSYNLCVTSTGVLRLMTSVDGTTIQLPVSTVAVQTASGVADGAALWVRARRVAATGTVTFEWAADQAAEPSAWTQLGTTVATTPGGILNSTAVVEVGTNGVGTLTPLAGKIHRAIVRTGATLAVDFDPSTRPDGATTWIGADGGVWTLTRTPNYADTNDPTFLKYVVADGKYAFLSGVASNYISTPDSAQNSVVGDLDFRTHAAAVDWTPGALQIIGSKWIGVSFGWQFYLLTTGHLAFNHSTDGTTTVGVKQSTAVVPAADGAPIHLRVTLDVDNGAGGHTVTFYTSADGITWTQLGDAIVTAGVTSIGDATGAVQLGANDLGSNTFAGKIYSASLRNGINGTVVASFAASAAVSPQATVAGEAGETWTLNRGTSGKKLALVDRTIFLFGVDDYLEIVDNPLLDFAAGDSFTVACGFRRFGTAAANDPFLSKSPNAGLGANAGWHLITNSGSADAVRVQVGDGVDSANNQGAGYSVGVPSTAVGRLDRTGATLQAYGGGVAVAAATSTTLVDSIANTRVLRVGAFSDTVTGAAAFEFVSAGVWRSALSAAEIANLTGEMAA